ncbi:MAG TPA: transcriptional regulator GcvA [Candidatus Acidoferrum sp.]|nr:transcriptional regulator GcvA [Candidatus Acidoferrum sp.]
MDRPSKLPPLSAIRAFEAAARHGSFTKAAEELGMTQAAVSYQVKLLEDRLGAPLFLRQARRVVLSETGRRLAPPVTEAFQRLQAAFAATRETNERVLSVTVIQSFATSWLVPRLGTFQMAHPDIAVRVDASGRIVDLAREDIDVGIRTGSGDWPGLKAHLLMPSEFTPLCSPEFLARSGPLASPADLLKLPLLDWRDPWWRQWFALAGVPDPQPAAPAMIEVDSQVMLGRAALVGQGVAILTPAYFAAELADGRLVQPFALTGRSESSFWLVYPQERQNAPKIRAFRDWMLAEVKRDAERAAG